MYVHISVRTSAADTAPEHFQRTDFLTTAVHFIAFNQLIHKIDFPHLY